MKSFNMSVYAHMSKGRKRQSVQSDCVSVTSCTISHGWEKVHAYLSMCEQDQRLVQITDGKVKKNMTVRMCVCG